MPVVRALDLDQHVAAGVRAHQARRFERRLGAGVRETPERELESVGEVLPDHVEVLRRLCEMRAPACLALERLDDLRMRVPDDHRAVPEVEVEVLVAVDVVDAVALAAIDEDRVRRRVLPAGSHAAGDVAVGDRSVSDRRPVLRLERRFLLRDELIDPLEVELDRVSWGAIGFSPPRETAAREQVRRSLNGRSGTAQMVPQDPGSGKLRGSGWYRGCAGRCTWRP